MYHQERSFFFSSCLFSRILSRFDTSYLSFSTPSIQPFKAPSDCLSLFSALFLMEYSYFLLCPVAAKVSGSGDAVFFLSIVKEDSEIKMLYWRQQVEYFFTWETRGAGMEEPRATLYPLEPDFLRRRLLFSPRDLSLETDFFSRRALRRRATFPATGPQAARLILETRPIMTQCVCLT